MAVIKIKLINTSGSISSGKLGMETKYTIKYIAITDSNFDGPVDVFAALDLNGKSHYMWPPDNPTAGSSDPWAVLKEVTCNLMSEKGSRKVWDVSLSYDSAADGKAPVNDSTPQDPLTFPVKWSGSFAMKQRKYHIWNDGEPILNSSGEPREIMADDNVFTLRASFNMQYLPLDDFLEIKNAVNADTWQGFPANSFRVQSLSFDYQDAATVAATPYYQCRLEWEAQPYNIEDRQFGWFEALVDSGLMIIGSDGYPRRITHKDVRPDSTKTGFIDQPVKLDGSGGVYDPTDIAGYVLYPEPLKSLYPQISYVQKFGFLGAIPGLPPVPEPPP